MRCNHTNGFRRHCSSPPVCSWCANVGSPANVRKRRIVVAVSRSSAASCSMLFTVCADGLSLMPASHIGYHSFSATSRTAASFSFGGCSSTTSMSLPGHNSAPAYPPVATSAQPAGSPAARLSSHESAICDSRRASARPARSTSPISCARTRRIVAASICVATIPPVNHSARITRRRCIPKGPRPEPGTLHGNAAVLSFVAIVRPRRGLARPCGHGAVCRC
ncbi:unannotated protein [freshwater metagenome]|uniref:Unannotated protein n=1 Tax=freshwater metagenome TaxID=449393 RepID=A0A6J7CDZ3_9ZZZZ